jgi:hypothetical protein
MTMMHLQSHQPHHLQRRHMMMNYNTHHRGASTHLISTPVYYYLYLYEITIFIMVVNSSTPQQILYCTISYSYLSLLMDHHLCRPTQGASITPASLSAVFFFCNLLFQPYASSIW